MFRTRSRKLTYGILLVAFSSLAITACESSGGSNAHTSKAPTEAASSGSGSPATAHTALSIGTGVHVTNTPTKAFRVKPVDTTESVAVGPTGYPVYTFQGETTQRIICQKTAIAKTNCWGFWPPVSVSSSNGISKQSGISGELGTFSNHGVLQLTLNGQPLYYFTPDLASKSTTQAAGDQLNTFGSIWHIVATG
jgi:predicted lipoprotein with Yx(FWY)xxD motif